MSDFDLLVRGCEQDLGINEGRIAAAGANLSGSATEEIDATRLMIFPGVIDAHVHFNEPGRTDWEGWETGARAAAAGGSTTVFDMPLNAHPPTIDGPSFDQKRAAAEQRSLVDFGLWGGLVPGNLEALEVLRDRGVVGLKAFMSESGIEDFAAVNYETLREGMQRAAELDLLVAVHAESNAMIRARTEQELAAGRTTARDYLASRPLTAELEAIRIALDLAAETGCRLHIVHVSTGRGVALVTQARARGLAVTCETCPHYLFLTEDDVLQLGAVAKCAPPLRSRTEQAGLWEQLPEVATIGSDHSPAPWSMKESPNFFQVWGGISGCQHLLSLLASAPERLSPPEIIRLTSTGVAELFRIPQKGGLAPGKDADFTLVDDGVDETVHAEALHYRHAHSPYVGRKMKVRIVRTVLRGQTIFEDGSFKARPAGRLVMPASHIHS